MTSPEPRSSGGTRPRPAQNNRRAVFEVLGAALMFAMMATIAQGLRTHIAWPVIALVRIAITLGLAYYLVWLYKVPFLVKGTRALWWRSISGSIALLCNFYAFTHLPVTDAVTILATSPIWITIILAVVFKHSISPMVCVHVMLVVVGVYVMQRPTFDADSIPLAVALFASFVVSIVKISLSRCSNLHPVSVIAHYATFGTLSTVVMCFLVVNGIVLHDGVSMVHWAWLLPLGLVGTAAQIFMTNAYAHGNTTMVALVGLSNIAWASLFDVLVWGRRYDLYDVIGITLIATGIALSVTRNAKDDAAEQRSTGANPI